MVGSNCPYSFYLLSNAGRRDRTGKPFDPSRKIVLQYWGTQPFSPAKTIFTGIGVLLAVSLTSVPYCAMSNIQAHRQQGTFLRTTKDSLNYSNGFTSSLNVWAVIL